jgi:hypothetical protein
MFSIEKIITKDNFILEGLFFEADNREVAVIFIHGFPTNFCKDINLIKRMGSLGYSVLSLNTRGHDILSIIPKVDKGYEVIGSAKENFEDCVFDIGGAIGFLKEKGYKKIFLMGISSGADKVGFYLSRNKESVVLGGIFISPGSNISIIRNELGEDFFKLREKALKCIDEGKGDELLFGLGMDFPVSCKRFVSLYSEDSSENVFPFHNKNSDFPILAKIKETIFVALGEEDSFLEDPKLLLKVLKSKLGGKSNEFKLFKAEHSFDGVEEELVCQIKAWVGGNCKLKNYLARER